MPARRPGSGFVTPIAPTSRAFAACATRDKPAGEAVAIRFSEAKDRLVFNALPCYAEDQVGSSSPDGDELEEIER